MQTQHLRVTGIVQGVGFRPFVWRLAQQLNLSGWVRNDTQGVEILAQGSPFALAELRARLRTDAPPLARVDSVQTRGLAAESFTAFSIIASQSGQAATAIGPDVAVCADCLEELFDPSSRRWRHAFITCTHCGPRFTVTRALPYDRPQTSMAAFPLCPDCSAEYTAPANRRFHAETTCCPQCGPRLSLSDAQGQTIAGDPITQSLRLLQSGSIVAIKGLGGFHLACDARNVEAVARLRLRKHREAKPFAVMLANAASVAPFAQFQNTERALLASRERPIVLLPATTAGAVALPGVAPGLLSLGVMLPTTPIHYLLFHEAAGRPAGSAWLVEPQAMVLVMTSANPGGEPMVRDTQEAHTRLAGIADAFLDHDREIVARCDDSVIRPVGKTWQFVRRSRGYAPAAIRLTHAGPSVLAFGAHLKNTVCVTRGDEAFLSPHIGDLDDVASCEFLDETVLGLCALLDTQPALVAHDLHPDSYSTRAALAYAQQHDLPTLAVQHHHAHLGAVCAEHGWYGPVLGLALDGVGLGTDGTAWGGELLRVDGATVARLGHLQPLPMPGADSAARAPWRMAAAVLHELGRNDEIVRRCQDPAASTVAAMLLRQFNCPRTSSMGRLFDAAAGLLGISATLAYEAQAAMLLEQAATGFVDTHGWPEPLPGGYAISNEGQLNLLPLLASLIDAGDAAQAATSFHATLVTALTDWVLRASQSTGLTTLAWGGGCFLNALVSTQLRQNLERCGIMVLAPRLTSPGDGSIALGQAWVALQYLEKICCVWRFLSR
ncbi:MAG: carbamoyltransferase HypF [Rhodoferax sp.]|uniref:carbamoyltransferase HypF n=1 Tax=Rhodoferax sp. TaxID=50421 RepID=UPI00273769A4|nr:carbamoyltransferase HypF [Rhodoferax sp.]MDP3338323.1 carbamoyltransferase HypF [Rhodoferax sp.]